METARPYRFKDAATLLEDFWAEVDKLLSHLMKTLRVGIASYEQMKARTLSIARGEFRPTADEPKVWFRSTAVSYTHLDVYKRQRRAGGVMVSWVECRDKLPIGCSSISARFCRSFSIPFF